jgi:hypothetical protein
MQKHETNFLKIFYYACKNGKQQGSHPGVMVRNITTLWVFCSRQSLGVKQTNSNIKIKC